MDEEGRVYIVCDCGHFYGDIRFYPGMTVDCPACGSETASAFRHLDKALETAVERQNDKLLDKGQDDRYLGG